jgi:hypothetical protein
MEAEHFPLIESLVDEIHVRLRHCRQSGDLSQHQLEIVSNCSRWSRPEIQQEPGGREQIAGLTCGVPDRGSRPVRIRQGDHQGGHALEIIRRNTDERRIRIGRDRAWLAPLARSTRG